MFPSAIRRLSVPLAATILRASVAIAEPTTVGAVDKVQAQVEAMQAGQTRALVVKSEIYFGDRCHSTEGARLQATLKDGTQLTLGENATHESSGDQTSRRCCDFGAALPSQGSARGVRSKTTFTKACKALAAARSGDWLGDGGQITL